MVKIVEKEEYFKQKLVISKDVLKTAERNIENTEIQITALTNQYEYNLGLLNARVKRSHEIVEDTKKRIKDIEAKLRAGQLYIDIATGKTYKTQAARDKAIHSRLEKEAKKQQEKIPETPEVESLDDLLKNSEE